MIEFVVRPTSLHEVPFADICSYCGIRTEPYALAANYRVWEHVENIDPGQPRRRDVHQVVPACRSCNSSKNAKGLIHFLLDMGRTLVVCVCGNRHLCWGPA